MSTSRLAARVLLCVFSGCGAAWAQAISVAQVQGTVQDSTGGALPGVTITMTQTATGLVRTTVSEGDGRYLFPALPVGPYRLEATLDGFSKFAQTGIVLQVNVNPTIPITLALGALTDLVTVEASTVTVETQSTGIGQVIDQRRIVELPLNGRDVTQLIYLTGAVSDGRASRTNYPGTAFPALAGGGTGTVAFSLDGGTHNDPLSNGNLPLPFPDALQEFKVETSSLPANYGYHSMGAVNAVTKSGTNQMHGAAFEFLRHYLFNARPAFALEKDTIKRNQFGGTLGGPVMTDRLFFFGAYQGTVQRSLTSFTNTVPTPAMLAGDFSTITSPACRTAGQLNLPAGAGFINNRINPALLHPIAVNIARTYLPINQADQCGIVRYTGHAPNNNPTEHQVVGRMDYQMNAKQSMFGRYFQTRLETPTGNAEESPLLISGTGQIADVKSLVFGHTYIIGSNIVSQFRATGNKNSQLIKLNSYFNWPDLGVRDIYQAPSPPYPKFISGLGVGAGTAGFNLGSTPSIQPYQTLHVSEDLSMTLRGGAHQINFGGNWIDLRAFAVNEINRNGGFTFSGLRAGGGLGLVDFLLGLPSGFTQTAPVVSNQRQTVAGLYIQDVWRAARGFTVNAGVRWDPNFAHQQPLDVAFYVSEEALQRGIKSTRYPNAPAGTLFRGDAGGPTGEGYYNNKLLNFSPRVGLAWDPQADGRMSVRLSYGLLHEIPSMAYDQFGFARPLGMQITRANPLFEDPWSGYPGGNPFPRVFGMGQDAEWPFPGLLTISYKPETRNPYVHQWNLSVEKQLTSSWLVSGTYLGNSTIHLWADYNPNPTLPLAVQGPCVINGQTFNPCAASATGAPVNVEARRRLNLLNPTEGRFYGTVGILDDGGTAHYNGLVLSARGRFGTLLNATTNYTWAHCVSDPYTTGLGIGGFQTSKPSDRRFDRGTCVGHRNRVFNFSALASMPRLANRMAQLLAGNWNLSVAGRFQSGLWFNATVGDRALTATPNQRPNQVLDDVYAPNKSADLWLNPAAFALPALGTYGDMAVNTLLGPKNIQLDLALTRAFDIVEGQRLEFRMEAFNFANIVNLNNPNANLTSPDFGKIHVGTTGSQAPRIMQFALKYLF